MAELWSKEPPEESGWYWVRDSTYRSFVSDESDESVPMPVPKECWPGRAVYAREEYGPRIPDPENICHYSETENGRRFRYRDKDGTMTTMYPDADKKRAALLEKGMADVEEIIGIQEQDGNWNFDPYMHGLLNGLYLATDTLLGRDSIRMREAPDKWRDIPPRLALLEAVVEAAGKYILDGESGLARALIALDNYDKEASK